MRVYQHADPDSLALRSHPWRDAVDNPAHRYVDFVARPALIRSSLEDLRPWSRYPAIETFYQLLEWLNGSQSVFESNDCAFEGATLQVSAASAPRLACSGRLMILFRDLVLNTSPSLMERLTLAVARALNRVDPLFEAAAFGATITAVRYVSLPASPARQRGHQLMLSFWGWGDDEAEVMANLDRAFVNLGTALRGVSNAMRAAPGGAATGNWE